MFQPIGRVLPIILNFYKSRDPFFRGAINKFENKEERFLYGGRVKIISSFRMLAE